MRGKTYCVALSRSVDGVWTHPENGEYPFFWVGRDNKTGPTLIVGSFRLTVFNTKTKMGKSHLQT